MPQLSKSLLHATHRQGVLSLYRRCLDQTNRLKSHDVELGTALRSSLHQSFRKHATEQNERVIRSQLLKCITLSKLAAKALHEPDCYEWNVLRRCADRFMAPPAPMALAARAGSRIVLRHLQTLQEQARALGGITTALSCSEYHKMPKARVVELLDELPRYIDHLKKAPDTQEATPVRPEAKRSNPPRKPIYRYELCHSSGVWFVRDRFDKHNNRLGTRIRRQIDLAQRSLDNAASLRNYYLHACLEDTFEQLALGARAEAQWSSALRTQLVALRLMIGLRRRRQLDRGQQLALFVHNHQKKVDEQVRIFRKRGRMRGRDEEVGRGRDRDAERDGRDG